MLGNVEIFEIVELSTHFITITPFLVAASESILSVPVPARPMMQRLDASITSAVTLVAERTTNPSYFCSNTKLELMH